MTPTELAAWNAEADILKTDLRRIHARAEATLEALGYSIDPAAAFVELSETAAKLTKQNANKPIAIRDYRRARVAMLTLGLAAQVSRYIQPRPCTSVDLVRAVHQAVKVGAFADDAVMDRWLAHGFSKVIGGGKKGRAVLDEEQAPKVAAVDKQISAEHAKIRQRVSIVQRSTRAVAGDVARKLNLYANTVRGRFAVMGLR